MQGSDFHVPGKNFGAQPGGQVGGGGSSIGIQSGRGISLGVLPIRQSTSIFSGLCTTNQTVLNPNIQSQSIQGTQASTTTALHSSSQEMGKQTHLQTPPPNMSQVYSQNQTRSVPQQNYYPTSRSQQTRNINHRSAQTGTQSQVVSMPGVGATNGQHTAIYPHSGIPIQSSTMYVPNQVSGLPANPHQQNVYSMSNQMPIQFSGPPQRHQSHQNQYQYQSYQTHAALFAPSGVFGYAHGTQHPGYFYHQTPNAPINLNRGASAIGGNNQHVSNALNNTQGAAIVSQTTLQQQQQQSQAIHTLGLPIPQTANFNCTLEQFSCRSDVSECIALNWMCDDNPDCPDGSDEFDCNETCRTDEFTCANKHCIQRNWICDYDDDCGDNTDEEHCDPPSCDLKKDFSCTHNYCISSKWRCDGDFDCPNKLDEIGCRNDSEIKNISYCSSREFDCRDQITCIHKNWLCDGDVDCPDGSDESSVNCKSLNCRSDQFQCSNHVCIPGHLSCNGKIDCIDKSDEKNCTKPFQSCNELTEIECFEGYCVSVENLCHKYIFCPKWKDEYQRLCKVNECLNNNGGCSHECIDLPIGFQCKCYRGYQLIDEHNCGDINECFEPGNCSHFCTNEEGSYQCSCAIGYLKDPRNDTRCKAAEGHASLLFARRYDIRKIALDRKEITSIINNTKMATALDFVFRTGMIFWSDVSEKKIYKAPIDEGSEKKSVIEKDSTISDGLAIDWVYNHVYWTDAEKNTISLANFDGNMRKTLIHDHIQEPRAIALNPLEGWMFWTDWGDEARIEKAGMDGTHRMVLIGVDIKWPNGLTLDLIAKRIYWVDAKLNIIGSCDYDGANRRTVLHSSDYLKHPFSITMFEDFVYWTDWNKETIFKANKFNGKDVQNITSINSLQHPMAVHVYHPYKQPDGINECQYVNGHCSHLCLPSPKLDEKSPILSCACPDGLTLSSDGLMCTEASLEQMTSAIEHDIMNESYNRRIRTTFTIICAFFGASLTFLLIVTYYKYYFQQNARSMNFDNPVYRKTTENQINIEKNKFTYSTGIVDEESTGHFLSISVSNNNEK